MANNISGRQWILDTASATPIFKTNVKIVDANWMNATAGGTLSFTDLGGRTFTYIAPTPNDYPVPIGKLEWMFGLVLTRIDSGLLYMIIGK